MTNLIWDTKFKNSYKKRIANNTFLKEKFWKAIDVFCQDPFDPKLRTHKLTGKLKDLWAFSVSHDCRIIFKFVGSEGVLLIDIGSHEEVY